MRTEHQLDQLFTKGFMFLNRKRKEFGEEKKIALQTYYKNVISPAMRRYFNDEDFEMCSKIILVGGGSLHKDLVDLFVEEFGDFCSVNVVANPEKCASVGYALYSKHIAEDLDKDNFSSYSAESEDKKAYVGVDIGNANTCVSVYSATY